MAKLIDKSDISTLHTAEELRDVASSAESIHEIESIARACNLSANTGETSTTWDKSISQSAMLKLKSNGYTVTANPNSAKAESMYTISWEKT